MYRRRQPRVACALGDEVVLIGRQEGAHIRAEDAANRVGTNNYDIVSRILPRVPRVLSSS
jgi:alanine racemase